MDAVFDGLGAVLREVQKRHFLGGQENLDLRDHLRTNFKLQVLEGSAADG